MLKFSIVLVPGFLNQKGSCSQKFFKIGVLGLQIFKEKTQTEMFSCEIYEMFKNIFFYRAPPMAASTKNTF